jgi:hypothetical protein
MEVMRSDKNFKIQRYRQKVLVDLCSAFIFALLSGLSYGVTVALQILVLSV